MTLEPVLTVAQVAEHIGCSKKHVYRLIHTGKLRHLKFGARTYRIPVSAIEECGLNMSHYWFEPDHVPNETASDDNGAHLIRLADRIRGFDPVTS